jgi:hypothetical protein
MQLPAQLILLEKLMRAGPLGMGADAMGSVRLAYAWVGNRRCELAISPCKPLEQFHFAPNSDRGRLCEKHPAGVITFARSSYSYCWATESWSSAAWPWGEETTTAGPLFFQDTRRKSFTHANLRQRRGRTVENSRCLREDGLQPGRSVYCRTDI